MKTESSSFVRETGAISGELLLRNLLALPADELGFSPGLARALDDAYVPTVKDLVIRTEAELLRWRNIGPKRIEEIKTHLSALGLTLGMDSEAVQFQHVIDLALSRGGSPTIELTPRIVWLWAITANADARCRAS